MSDKLEALKAAALAATPGPWHRSGVMFNGITSEQTFMTQGNKPHIANAGEKRDAIFIAQANPAAVLELLAALEEKDQQIKELEEFAKLALEKIPNEKASPDFYIVGNGPCFLAYPESMGPEARGDLAGNLRKAYLSPTHWKERAKSAEQQLELVREQRDNELRTNAELEQRLQQPIKLPDIRSEDYHESGWFQHMKYYRDVVRSIRVLELKVEGE